MNEDEFIRRTKELVLRFRNLPDEKKRKFVSFFDKLKADSEFEALKDVIDELEKIFKSAQ